MKVMQLGRTPGISDRVCDLAHSPGALDVVQPDQSVSDAYRILSRPIY